MNVFTLKSAKIMPQKDGSMQHPDYGYTWWCNVSEIDLPVMFSSKKELKGFETIAAEEADMKTSAKGNDYMLLKKVKVAESSGSQSGGDNSPQATNEVKSQPAADLTAKLDEILEIVKELRGDVEEKVVEMTQSEIDGMPPEFLK